MGRTISVVTAVISLVLGVLFIIGSFTGGPVTTGTIVWWVIGGVLVCVGAFMMWLGTRPPKTAGGDAQNVTLKIDLPGNVAFDTMKCKSCGGALSAENIKMVAGAPMVTCPFCHTQYQLTEEPKW